MSSIQLVYLRKVIRQNDADVTSFCIYVTDSPYENCLLLTDYLSNLEDGQRYITLGVVKTHHEGAHLFTLFKVNIIKVYVWFLLAEMCYLLLASLAGNDITNEQKRAYTKYFIFGSIVF